MLRICVIIHLFAALPVVAVFDGEIRNVLLQWRRGSTVFGGSQRSEFSDKEAFFPTKFSWDIMDRYGQISLNCRHFEVT